MKDVTTTSFGLVIAYVLPGLVGLYSLTFWSGTLKSISQTFYTAQSNLGLSLMVLAASVVVGLQVNAARFLLYERLLCRTQRITADIFKIVLAEQARVSGFTTILEENFRYHQFFGSMTLLLPLLQASLLMYLNHNVPDFWFIFITTLFTVLIAFLIFLRHEIGGGTAGLKDYVWCRPFLKRWSQRLRANRAKVAIWVATVACMLLYALWLYLYQAIANRVVTLGLVFGFVLLEVITGVTAIVALRRYVERLMKLTT